jgi:hypothetical protein
MMLLEETKAPAVGGDEVPKAVGGDVVGVVHYALVRPRLAAEREKKRGDFRALIVSTFGNYQ